MNDVLNTSIAAKMSAAVRSIENPEFSDRRFRCVSEP